MISQFFFDYPIKQDELVRKYSTHGRDKKCIQISDRELLTGRDRLKHMLFQCSGTFFSPTARPTLTMAPEGTP
jgi:hypothetical protein